MKELFLCHQSLLGLLPVGDVEDCACDPCRDASGTGADEVRPPECRHPDDAAIGAPYAMVDVKSSLSRRIECGAPAVLDGFAIVGKDAAAHVLSRDGRVRAEAVDFTGAG